MQIFITATDTNVGKTLISTWLCLHFKMSYWKPIQTGAIEITDTQFVKSFGIKTFEELYKLKQPISPHIAAQIDNQHIDLSKIQLIKERNLIIEGVGGVLVPLNKYHTILDLISRLTIPVIVIARSSLGTINHTCLTLEMLYSKNLNVLGIIMNGEKNIDNQQAIEYYGKIKVLQAFPQLDIISPEKLLQIKPTIELVSSINP